MTAFADVVFLLLIFFLLHYRLEAENQIFVDVQLPEVSSPQVGKEKKEEKFLVVSITADGKIFVQEKEVEEQLLKEVLIKMIREENWKRSILQADRVSSYGTVMRILDILKKIGIEEISLAVEEKSN